ncbi:MAG: ACT domain-containing protein, partial [Holophagae bacterium]|nr:ACT domain-containing protein [Holophagae bacterium]
KLGLHTVESVSIRENVGVVAVVGEGIRTQPGIAARMFTALASACINVRMIAFGASPVAAYFVVNRKDRVLSVQAIHHAFFNRVVTP